MEKLSLLGYCIPCKAKCCMEGKLIGSPILSKDEVLKIKKIYKGSIEEVVTPLKKKYYIIKEKKGTNICYFLIDEYKCKIQNLKPLDCLCYPIKAVYDKESIKFVIDTNCPASKHLNKRFIEDAKIIALRSIKRFDKDTYEHWLNNYIGWVKQSIELNLF